MKTPPVGLGGVREQAIPQSQHGVYFLCLFVFSPCTHRISPPVTLLCCSLTASAALLNAKLTLQKNQFLLLRLLLLSHGHYSRFCCSLTASAALFKGQIDPTKEPIPPLAASPTLSRPLFPLLLLSYSLCCSS
jgi:hypothetical protein